MHYERELAVARRIATASADLAVRYFAQGIAVEEKSDDSPVTNADKDSEAFLANALDEAFPDDGQLGEEGVAKESKSGRVWIIDPIDGTRDFVRGNPLWGVLIGLEDQGKPVAGVAHFPILQKTYVASVGGGAWCNDRPIRVSTIDRVEKAVVCFNGLQNNRNWKYRGIVMDFLSQFWAVRSMSGSPDVMMVASGQADIWIEPSAKPWDLCPMKVIVEEAGGRFLNFKGTDSIHEGGALVCNPHFEQLVRETFVGKA
jgi:histidinol phosphatase-like enzyme (inositol monophosphatase family)